MKKQLIWALTLVLLALFPYQSVRAYDYCTPSVYSNQGIYYSPATAKIKVNGTEALSLSINSATMDLYNSESISIEPGDTWTFVLTGAEHTKWSSGYLYLDLNQDGDFSDSGESITIYDNPLVQFANTEYTVTIPDFTWNEGVTEFGARYISGEAPRHGNSSVGPCTGMDRGAAVTFKVIKPRQVLDRSNWQITVDGEGYDSTNSSSSVEGPKNNIKDGNTGTFWHSYYSGATSSWGNENLPHYFQIDLGSVQSFDLFNYVSRNGLTSQNGNIVNYKLYISNNDMTTSLGNGSVPTNGTLVKEGSFTYNGSNANHIVALDKTYGARYVYLQTYTTQC